MTPAIAIVGMACRYPDARSPVELWENTLAGRQAFRRLPPERLCAEDYYSSALDAPDRTYSVQAALIEDYEFDRVHFNISGNTFRSTDMAHWLALDVAAQAIADAGFAEGPPRESTGVYLGNTLTGEFSRANTLRLRWPYVRRVICAALAAEDWPPEKLGAFLENLEHSYKEPFPPVGEDTLAGGLSNTIAGRICNYFDLKGGGYTVDGACASSMLAVATACTALTTGDIKVALAGGVDLSLDPFELVGFAKTRALAAEEMRVYDAHSAGFWPGEGCGFLVLMRQADAQAQHRRIYATIRGWGISSDGSGGISRPEPEGQLLAVRRAYCRAGFPPSTIAYFEGHGTGTTVGDATELQVLSTARRESNPGAPAAVIGSVKANIGHTKAAAAVAGVIKAVMAMDAQILPPATSCQTPHALLTGAEPALRVLRKGEQWPADMPLRAAASAMGFGGINVHVVLERESAERRQAFSAREQVLLCSAQDAELFLFTSLEQVKDLAAIAARLSRAELIDAAASLAAQAKDASPVRAAVIASTPEQLAEKLAILEIWLKDNASFRADLHAGVFLGKRTSPGRIGFLFPGQGSPVYADGGALRRRFEYILEGGWQPDLPIQPAIVQASLAALQVLRHLSVTANVAVGHSLGELTAIHWAGAIDETELMELAAARQRIMSRLNGPAGKMASIALDATELESLIGGEPVVIAGYNAPRQTVVSGEAGEVEHLVSKLRLRGIAADILPVSHAFHSSLMETAADPLARYLAGVNFQPLERTVISTVTGAALTRQADLRDILRRQVASPVRFTEALGAMRQDVDLWIEVGPGSVLTGLARNLVSTPVIPVDAGGPSLQGLLRAFGAAFAMGVSVNCKALFDGRLIRPFKGLPRFLGNPCETAPAAPDPVLNSTPRPAAPPPTALELVRQLVAERTELPLSAIQPGQRLLSDLHLNSITVAQILVEAARRRGSPPPVSTLQFADTTVAAVAEMLDRAPSSVSEDRVPSGIDSWIRAFRVELTAVELRESAGGPSLPNTGAPWQTFVPDSHPLASELPRLLPQLPAGGGVLVCLPPAPDERHIPLLLQAVHAALACEPPGRFLLAQHGGGAAGLARTLHLESGLITCVVDLPFYHPSAADWIAAEAYAAKGYSEAHYDAAGRRYEPVLRLLPAANKHAAIDLDSSDVLLVTGGGKGIAAECALALARKTGVKLALLGRSDPSTDPDLTANLERMKAAGVCVHYLTVDLTDAASVESACREIERSIGSVAGLLHGAGINQPRLLGALDEASFRATLAPKLEGLRNLLSAVDPARLRLLVAFGSIIARMGLAGEGDYALANEWLTRSVERWGADHPHCRCSTIEWSVWSGLGMGQRLGRIEDLMRQGIVPITPEAGVRAFNELLSRDLPSSTVVTGRFGTSPTLKLAGMELPFARFLERPRVHYPGVELIADAVISQRTDPYLEDHVFQGTPLLPAVIGMEAMAQVAMAVSGTSRPPVFEDVRFTRSVQVPREDSVTLRVAALVRSPGVVEVALRSSETGFQVDHFKALCRMGGEPGLTRTDRDVTNTNLIPLDPDTDLYGSILFQSGRFRRLRGYYRLRATECLAEIIPDGRSDWFARYLPATLALGDPGARDAFIHSVQACIPHATVLPTGVDRIAFGAAGEPGPRFVHARERSFDGTVLVYDLDVTDSIGNLVERWEGLQLRIVAGAAPRLPWPVALLAAYLERKVRGAASGVDLAISLGQNGTSHAAIEEALGRSASVHKRLDGKPEVNGHNVSTAHAGDLVLAAAGGSVQGCDLEPVCQRSTQVWRDLLGPEYFVLAEVVVRETGEDIHSAATRVWCAMECLKKAGAMPGGSLIFLGERSDGWVDFGSGLAKIATCGPLAVRGVERRLAFAVMV